MAAFRTSTPSSGSSSPSGSARVALPVYQVVLFGSQALGAVFWGFDAVPLGLVPTFLFAAALMGAGVATIRVWPLIPQTLIRESRPTGRSHNWCSTPGPTLARWS